MNHSTPLRFIAAILTLCLSIICTCRPLSARNTLSSAHAVAFGSEKRVTIAAYDTEYFYFQIPASHQNSTQKLCIDLAGNTAGLQVTALDSSGAVLSLKKNNTTYELSSMLPSAERCFLRIYNSLPTEQTATLSISWMPLKAPTKKPVQSGKKKTAYPKSYTSQRNQKPIYKNRTPLPTSNQPPVTRKPTKTKSRRHNHFPTASPTTVLQSLKTHFVRLPQGTSLFLAERLFEKIPEENITFIPSSPSVSVSNGILYVPKDGLYYLTIEYGNKHTSCTILVTPK